METREQARQKLIARTARIWSKLNHELVKTLKGITHEWVKDILKEAEQEASSGYIETLSELPARFTEMLSRILRESLAQGMWLQELYLEAVRGKKHKGRVTLSDIPEGDELRELLEEFIEGSETWYEVIPQAAIDWLNEYVPKLSGILNRDVLESVRSVLSDSLQNGSTLRERMKALRECASELLSMTDRRIESIARTEITRADTMGRLIGMKSNEDVIGFEFSAIMDDRTTEMCISRHGLVMRLDDPRLPENTPPIHVNCRSLLLPLTVYDYPDGLETSPEFGEVEAGTQRPEDIAEIVKLLNMPE